MKAARAVAPLVANLLVALSPSLAGVAKADMQALWTRDQGGVPVTVLDQASYLRRYCRFGSDLVSPAALKAQGPQLLGQGQYDRLKSATEKTLSVCGNDNFAVFHPSALVLKEARKIGTTEAMKKARLLPTADWREAVFRRLWFDPYTAPPPPEDWAQPGFDDSDWVADRGGFQVDMPDDLPPEATRGNMANVHVNALQFIGAGLMSACYRGRFVLDEPAKAGELTFAASYRGGLRVLVNGQELARAHLPKGKLAPEAAADDYPLEAYTNPGLRNRTLGLVKVPAQALRAGANVLAIEVRASPLHPTILKVEQDKSWNALHDREGMWRHGFLGKFQLRGVVGQAPGRSSAGLLAWTPDMHFRVRSDDAPPSGESKAVLRFVGLRNGSCSAQLALVSDKDVATLKATAGEVRNESGAAIPASAISVFHMLPFPADGFGHKLGDERGLGGTFPNQTQLQQHAGMPDAGQPYVFDHITARAQPLVAGKCRPLWITMKVPAAAPPGRYRGRLGLQADGQAEIQVPVEAEVIGWRVPDPKDFQTYVGLEQNPYGVARQYGLTLWSPEHFKLLEASFRQIARAGGTWLNVPVVRGTEFGNRDDSMIRWLRKKDDTLAYDFALLDKYLDLAVEHLGKPRMINFVVMPGLDGPNFQAPVEIMVADEATGKAAPLPACGAGVALAQKQRIWRPFATALYQHLKAKGLDKAMHWGYPLDSEMDHELVALLGEHLPAVKWHGGPHQIGTWGYNQPKYYDLFGTVRYFDNWPGFRLSRGWKAPQVHLTIPRIDSSVQSLITASHPFAFRTLVNHSLALGRCGFSRVGADEWASSHYDGMRVPAWIVGMPVLCTLWPGLDGAESSARHEALLEGIQEGEARTFLDKALDSGRLTPALAQRVTDVLDRHYLETTFFQNKLCIHELEKYYYRWQQRSRELYQAAADVWAATGESRPQVNSAAVGGV